SLALLATACKPGLNNNEDAYLFAIASQQIRGLAEGNCAISLNLGTLYSGAIVQSAVSTATTFSEDDFNQASGTTATALGYANYTAVPYNVKYDAFIKGGGSYNQEARTTDINTAKAGVDAGSVLGAIKVTAQGINAQGGDACGASNANLIGAVNQFIGTFSSEEITALNPVLTALTNAVGGLNTTTIVGAGGLQNGAVCAGLIPADANASAAYQARQAYSNGTAVLACARIPRQSCNIGGFTTESRGIAIDQAVAANNTIANNSACVKPNSGFLGDVLRAQLTGLPRGNAVNGAIGVGNIVSNPEDFFNPISEGGTAPNNRIFAERAYPVSGALSGISTNFNVAFPISEGSTAQTTGKNGIAFYGGSNVNFKVVPSCEAIGMGSTGSIVQPDNATAATLKAAQQLTSSVELAYRFSPGNTAATQYAASTGPSAEAKAECNNSFREKFQIPLAIGGGKLPKIGGAQSGDGGATALLTTCLYGGTATGRTTSGQLLGAGAASLNGIQSCKEAAKSGAATFGDSGLDKLQNFPNNEPAN
ncbi:MAG: hypothetical protein JJT78_11820, partial [Leptospira sp.]|nr:hypothetical protein [Leptospira sp.]